MESEYYKKRQLARLIRQSKHLNLNKSLRDDLQARIHGKSLKNSDDPSSWSSIKEKAYESFLQQKNLVNAQNLCEQMLLYGSLEDISSVLSFLSKEGFLAFFSNMDSVLRIELIKIFLESNEPWFPAKLLTQEIKTGRLPEEKLYYFLYLFKENHKKRAAKFCENFENDILEAFPKLQGSLRLRSGEFYFILAQAFTELGLLERATNYLKQISSTDECYNSALIFYSKSAIKYEQLVMEEFSKQWLFQENPDKRLILLRDKLYEISCTKSIHLSAEVIALNFFLDDILSFFPNNAKFIEKVANLLCEFFMTEKTLPALFKIFKTKIFDLTECTQDVALWSGFLVDETHSLANSQPYFVALAALHSYLWQKEPTKCEKVTTAFFLLQKLEQATLEREYYNWQDLQKWAIAAIQTRVDLTTEQKETARRILRLHSTQDELSILDIEYCINLNISLKEQFISHLRSYTANKYINITLQLDMIKLSRKHMSNTELREVLDFAIKNKEPTIAWRIASILKFRGVLSPNLIGAWEISGENRSSYSLQYLRLKDIEACFFDFESHEKNFILSILAVIPLLISKKESHFSVLKNFTSSKLNIDPYLEKYSITKKIAKNWRNYSSKTSYLPPQLKGNLLSQFSTILNMLAFRFGLDIFSYDFTILKNNIESVLLNKEEYKISTNEIKSLRFLTEPLPDLNKDFQNLFAITLCRIAIVLYPAHEQALCSLNLLAAPYFLIEKTKAFIISNQYGRLRTSLANNTN